MSDAELRRLERAWGAEPGNLVLRRRLLDAGVRAGLDAAWASVVMDGPPLGTFLTWKHPSGPHLVHLVRAQVNVEGKRRGANSPLLCRCDTVAGRPDEVGGRPLGRRMTLWPLNLVWRRQGDVTCQVCVRTARTFLVSPITHTAATIAALPGASNPVEVVIARKPIDLLRPWSGQLAKHQATYWGRWHPALWPVE